jgi:hypothetical protein
VRPRAFVTVGLILVFAFAGSVNSPASGAKGAGLGSSLDRALRAWSAFPVWPSTRPLVLLEGYVLNPDGGFPDDNSKIAFGNGAITAPASWPSSATSDSGFPIVGAASAFKTLTTPGSVVGSPPPLIVTKVALGSGWFLTDRGPQLLPAWLFSLSGVQSPAKVLAVAPSRIYADPTGNSPTQLAVTVGLGNRRLVVSFPGAPGGNGPCTERYTSDIKESKKGRSPSPSFPTPTPLAPRPARCRHTAVISR